MANYYLVVLLLQLGSFLLVRLLVLCSFTIPHLTQFLGCVSNRESRILTLHLGAEFSTEKEECRPVGTTHQEFYTVTRLCCQNTI